MKYSLTKRWENDAPINNFNFDNLKELQEIDVVKKAMQNEYFHRLSILTSHVMSYYPPNYNIYTLAVELHDGYVYQELGVLTKNPHDKFNYGFPKETKLCPVVCLDFKPEEELNIPIFDYYNWIVYKLIGSSGAYIVLNLAKTGTKIDIIKKFIEHAAELEKENPPLYKEFNR
jgi:hypothetical protein